MRGEYLVRGIDTVHTGGYTGIYSCSECAIHFRERAIPTASLMISTPIVFSPHPLQFADLLECITQLEGRH